MCSFSNPTVDSLGAHGACVNIVDTQKSKGYRWQIVLCFDVLIFRHGCNQPAVIAVMFNFLRKMIEPGLMPTFAEYLNVKLAA